MSGFYPNRIWDKRVKKVLFVGKLAAGLSTLETCDSRAGLISNPVLFKRQSVRGYGSEAEKYFFVAAHQQDTVPFTENPAAKVWVT